MSFHPPFVYLKAFIVLLEALLVVFLPNFKTFLSGSEPLKVGFDDGIEGGTVVKGGWILRSLRDLIA